jgi:hypothetical protein
MRAESRKYIDSLQNCKNLAEKKRINDEFSLYYNSLDENGKKELNPYFDNLKNAINHKIEKLDILANKAESILAKFQVAEV